MARLYIEPPCAGSFRHLGVHSCQAFRRPRGTQSVAVPPDAFPRQLVLAVEFGGFPTVLSGGRCRGFTEY